MADLRKELLAIRGIGAETADVILVYAFSDDVARKRFFEAGLEIDPVCGQVYYNKRGISLIN